MHQAILMRAKKNPKLAEELSLRFIRSSSASLPPAVFDELKKYLRQLLLKLTE